MSKESDFGEVVAYIDGYAFGVSQNGQTVNLGSEAGIREILAHPRRRPENPTIAQIITLERELSKKSKIQKMKEQTKVEVERAEHRERAEALGVVLKKRKARVGRN